MSCTLATPCSPTFVEEHRAGWVTVVRERCTLGDHTLRTAVVGEAREERAVRPPWGGGTRGRPPKRCTAPGCGKVISRKATWCVGHAPRPKRGPAHNRLSDAVTATLATVAHLSVRKAAEAAGCSPKAAWAYRRAAGGGG